MVKPYLRDIDVECWQHPGKSLGFFTPTVCLFHSSVDHGQQLLHALDELLDESPVSKRTLTFRPCNRKRLITLMRLHFVLANADLRVMNIACDNGIATIEMTSVGLQVLRDAITSWCSGGEDFGIGSGHASLRKRELGRLDKSSGELWFWGPTMSRP